eukprot:TRINITY_DN2137_c0_g1_i3.p2 TRINITY_DN2137_c0_g1~~TRINITY_DN2137_c0_g1_i3.p2  ORF type:complete len:476 (+),score=158.81 TRINITY_DN2137_c0_g1_i3:986-2413(+)
MRIVNMTKVVQAAWASAAGPRDTRVDTVFWKASLDGSQHFLRHAQLFTFRPASGDPTVDTAILWLATTASVQKQVMAALVVFIIFACTVFVFDLSMALFEIYFVAIPLTKIAKSLDNLYTFEPELVLDTVRSVTVAACLSIKEVYEVATGLEVACSSLIEYKAFLPTTLFATVDNSSDCSSQGEGKGSSEVKSISSKKTNGSSYSVRSGGAKIPPTGVSLNNVKGSFVKVSFVADELPTAEVLTSITELVEHAANVVKGTVLISPCEPGTFYVSWNVSRKVIDSTHKAATFAEVIMKGKNPQFCVSAGMAHGTVAAGNVGSRSLRGFVIHGSLLLNLHAAQVYASRLQHLVATPVVVLNSKMGEMLIGTFATVAVGVLKVGQEKPDVMLCLKSSIEHETQEWMYQLDETKEDVLLEYFSQVARGAEIGLPTVEQGKLCAEQKSALTRARNGLLIEYYVKDAVQKLDMARNLVVEV